MSSRPCWAHTLRSTPFAPLSGRCAMKPRSAGHLCVSLITQRESKTSKMLTKVLAFWLNEIDPNQWRMFDPSFDSLLEKRFLNLLQQASAGELFAWRETPRGRLGEVIVLDQFSRNIYRGTALAFAQDPMALVLAQEAVAAGVLRELINEEERGFLLMPYMHSESRVIHVQAEALFKQHAPSRYEPELRHKAIIDRFGRYPHRNKILDRASTPEEMEFLTLPGSSF